MKPVKRSVRLFVSYDLASRSVAQEVIGRLRSAGAEVDDIQELTAGHTYSNEVREAIRAADAVVVVMTSEHLGANLLFELGAAIGAGKRVIVVASGIANVQLPLDVQVIPVARVEEVIDFARSAHAA